MTDISLDDVEDLINNVLKSMIEYFDNPQNSLSSEKTLVFKFMWEIAKKVNNDNLCFDFEYQGFKKHANHKYLDLLFWTNPNCKIAVEFKLKPNRKNVYRDIARLNHLVSKNINSISMGFFLCATTKGEYLNDGTSCDKEKIYHGYKYKQETSPFSEIDGLSLPKEFSFSWNEIKENPNYHEVKPGKTKLSKYYIKDKKGFKKGKYIAWLKPIVVKK